MVPFGAGTGAVIGDVIEIGEVEVDLRIRELRRNGERMDVQPRVFDLLVYLAEHRERVVTKAELLTTLWSGDAVVPDVLTTAFYSLRRALGDDAKQPSYVRTVPRVGYQLIADVRRGSPRSRAPRAEFPALEARHAAFVGRRREKALFADMLDATSDVQLLFVHGLPGIGKTTLLQELAYRGRAAERRHVWLSGGSIAPFVDAFVRALASGLGCAADLESVRGALASDPRVVFVDDVHLLQGIDDWLREELWPALPASCHLILAGRRPPSARWRCDPAWSRAARSVELSGLDIEDARALLERQGATTDGLDGLWSRTRGHPLALALASTLLAEGGGAPRRLDESFDAETLVAWFTDRLADPSRVRTLELASLFDEVSASELAALDASSPSDASDASSASAAGSVRWLASLPFVELVGGSGDVLRVHALVRDAVISRLASSDPPRLAELLERSQLYLRSEFRRATDPAAKYRAVQIMLGMGRWHPALRTNYEASDQGGECTVRPASARDHAPLLDVVRRHEGERSRAIVESWLAHPATRVTVVCDDEDVPAGFLVTLWLRLSDVDAAEAAGDPVTASCLRALARDERASPADEILLHRTMIARDDYQAPSVVTRHLHGAKVFIMWNGAQGRNPSHQVSIYGEADLWDAATASAGLARKDDWAEVIDGRRFTPFVVSFREQPMESWFLRAAARVVDALRRASKDGVAPRL